MCLFDDCSSVVVYVILVQAPAPYGFLGARNPPPFLLKMQDFASFFENFHGAGPPQPPPIEGHRRTRLIVYVMWSMV